MIVGEFFWTDGNSSINDNIRSMLKNKGISYYNTLGGKIIAQILGKELEVNYSPPTANALEVGACNCPVV